MNEENRLRKNYQLKEQSGQRAGVGHNRSLFRGGRGRSCCCGMKGLRASLVLWEAGSIPSLVQYGGLKIRCCHSYGLDHSCGSDLIWSLARELHMLWGGQKRKKERKKENRVRGRRHGWKRSKDHVMSPIEYQARDKHWSGNTSNNWKLCNAHYAFHTKNYGGVANKRERQGHNL